MHPALSLIVFTILTGAGYGMCVVLGLAWSFGLASGAAFTWPLAIAFLLIAVGLGASTAHLANPINAWRSFSQFRTSWLSREAVFAILFFPLFFLFAADLVLDLRLPDGKLYGAILSFAALVVVLCTSMIYASLKTIREWHSPLTPCVFLACSLASGVVLVNSVWLTVNDIALAPRSMVIAALAVVGILKMAYWSRAGTPQRIEIASATGIKKAESMSVLDLGHGSKNFIEREFCYEVGPVTLGRLRAIALVIAIVIPITLLAMPVPSTGALGIVYAVCVLSMAFGLFVERWLFFAEARHVVRTYYGT